jgi:putative redox protein
MQFRKQGIKLRIFSLLLIMETIITRYLGDLRTEATHMASKNIVITDAPLDNQGKGEAFSPTDLLAASLGSCMLTLMGIVAKRHQIDLGATNVKITKIMASEPRRVAEIHLDFTIEGKTFTLSEKKILENAAHTCPVSKSLHPDIQQKVKFNYLE